MTLQVRPLNIPTALRSIPAWAVWRYETDERGHVSKPPYQAFGLVRAYASATDTWSTFEDALRAYYEQQPAWEGISFALHESQGIVGIDLDHTPEHPDEAAEIVRALDTYTEYSPSGEGLRMFMYGRLPEGRRVRDWVEMYSDKRFLTVTGNRVDGSPTELRLDQRVLEVTWEGHVNWGERPAVRSNWRRWR